MIEFFKWYALLLILGWIAFPIAFRFLRTLPDKGYSLAKTIGILIAGYIYWLLGYAKILPVSSGGAFTAILVLVGISVILMKNVGPELKEWIGRNRKLILQQELLFLLVFASFAFMRAATPDITGTEKPMELAFINSILRSPSFPPNDPWLSGYSISYYYFGYVLIAMLTQVTGIASSIAYNLGGSSWFALTALGTFGLLFNLLSASGLVKNKGKAGWSLLAPIMVLIAGNFFVIFQMMHANGFAMTVNAEGLLQSGFWTWLNHSDLLVPQSMPTGWNPAYPGWFWWPASRTIVDSGLSGNLIQIIDEFPMFSLILLDLHPHVLNLPFVITAIGICLNIMMMSAEIFKHWFIDLRWYKSADFWFAAGMIGSLVFINTWDFPIYVGLLGLVVLWRSTRGGYDRSKTWPAIFASLLLGVAALVLYLPFFLGFSTAAGGILPSLNFITRGVFFWIHFGLFLIPILGMLLYWTVKNQNKGPLLRSFGVSALTFAVLFVLMILLALLLYQAGTSAAAAQSEGLLAKIGANMAGFFATQGLSMDGLQAGIRGLILDVLGRRLDQPGTWITLLLLGTLVLAAWKRKQRDHVDAEIGKPESDEDRTRGFVLLLVIVGLLLTTFLEFFYLRDVFGNRMNSIFKFYYQTWIVWGLAAAFAIVELIHARSKWAEYVFAPLAIFGLVLGLAYPVQMIPARTGYPGRPLKDLQIDGNAHLALYHREKWDGITWLRSADLGVVTEAEGAQYSDESGVSVHTGLPTIIGWTGHEYQWRSDVSMIPGRTSDLRTLYETAEWATAKIILDRYNVRYIWVGETERSKYQVSEQKFSDNLEKVFGNALVTIYEYAGGLR